MAGGDPYNNLNCRIEEILEEGDNCQQNQGQSNLAPLLHMLISGYPRKIPQTIFSFLQMAGLPLPAILFFPEIFPHLL
jgi:hypothetical protein